MVLLVLIVQHKYLSTILLSLESIENLLFLYYFAIEGIEGVVP
jgi:hypothetical protein